MNELKGYHKVELMEIVKDWSNRRYGQTLASLKKDRVAERVTCSKVVREEGQRRGNFKDVNIHGWQLT